MSLLKIRCPECNAGLRSSTGFTAGETARCPKCETDFTVEEPGDSPARRPADDDGDEDVKPKKRRRNDDDEYEEETRSYKNSPLRYAVLGVLVVVMVVLAYFLYDKKKKERETAAGDEDGTTDAGDKKLQPQLLDPDKRPKLELAGGAGAGGGKGRPVNPGKTPKDTNPVPVPKKGGGPDVGNIAAGAVGGLLSGGGPRTPQEAEALKQKHAAALVGHWTADLGGGATEDLTYTADGTFTARGGGKTASGKYVVQGLIGTKGLKLQLLAGPGPDPRTVTAVFEDGELQHPSLQPGVTATFRKK